METIANYKVNYLGIAITEEDTYIWFYTHHTTARWLLCAFQLCGSLEKPIRWAFFCISRYSATCSGLIFILSGVLQLLLAEEELLWPQRDALTETSVITPAEVLWAYRVLGCRISQAWAVSFPMICKFSHLPRTVLSGPSTKCKPRRKSIISPCTRSEIELDQLQDPVSPAFGFPWP